MDVVNSNSKMFPGEMYTKQLELFRDNTTQPKNVNNMRAHRLVRQITVSLFLWFTLWKIKIFSGCP